MKIRVDLDLCIGAGTCTVVAPKTFELDDELKVIPTKPKGNDEDTIIEAAKVFPSLHHNS
ncbi:ferredoxin [Patescibacteria group bacterium]|nr:ferredoxin [Patescibacteria group bacterium]